MRMSRCACFGAAERGDGPGEPASTPASQLGWVDDTVSFASGFDPSGLRVLTWNVQLLPGVFPGQGGCVAALESRTKQIVANVLALTQSTRVDVIAFQEVWHEGSAKLLQNGLHKLFPNQHRPAAYCGLLTVTRPGLQIYHSTFTPFQNTTGVEGWWFTKGVSGIAVRDDRVDDEEDDEDEGNKMKIILNAHLQSDYWNGGSDTRALQVPEIVDTLAVLNQRTADTAVVKILCGDLNVAFGSEEWKNISTQLGGYAVDVRGLDVLDNGDDTDNPYTFPFGKYEPVHFEQCFGPCIGFGAYQARTTNARLDYVIDVSNVRGPTQEMTQEATRVENKNASTGVILTGLGTDQSNGLPLSDHAPIFAVVG